MPSAGGPQFEPRRGQEVFSNRKMRRKNKLKEMGRRSEKIN